jgi:hypothetical protein
MTQCDDPNQFWRDRLAAKQAQLAAIETAITAVSSGVQSYQLNTGQTQQLVTKANLGSLRLMAKDLESDIATLQARLCGGAQFNVRPGW